MSYVEQVKSLNNKISAIQKERTKVETKKEMLLAKLNDELTKYNEKYGVSLRGENLDCICNKISAEREKVVNSVKEEYDLKVKIVTAIDSGDIKTANELLGIKEPDEVPNTEEVEEVSEVEEDEDIVLESSVESEDAIINDFGFGSEKVTYEKPAMGNSLDDVINSEGDFGFNSSEEDKVQKFEDDFNEVFNITSDSTSKGIEEVKTPSGFAFEEVESGEEEDEGTKIDVPDDFDFGLSTEEDSISAGSVKKTGHLNIGSTADDTVKELEKSKDENADMFGDVDLDDFGFGSMLQGSKFDI